MTTSGCCARARDRHSLPSSTMSITWMSDSRARISLILPRSATSLSAMSTLIAFIMRPLQFLLARLHFGLAQELLHGIADWSSLRLRGRITHQIEGSQEDQFTILLILGLRCEQQAKDGNVTDAGHLAEILRCLVIQQPANHDRLTALNLETGGRLARSETGDVDPAACRAGTNRQCRVDGAQLGVDRGVDVLLAVHGGFDLYADAEFLELDAEAVLQRDDDRELAARQEAGFFTAQRYQSRLGQDPQVAVALQDVQLREKRRRRLDGEGAGASARGDIG